MAKPETRDPGQAARTFALAGSGAMLVLVLAVALIERFDPDLYWTIVQEDHVLEWATVWLLGAATLLFGRAAARARKQGMGEAWFLAFMAVASFLVAMEEISWGQRLLGFLPPDLFLEHNAQLELNLHNLAATGLRKSGLSLVLAGYGLLLPLLAVLRPTGALLRRFGVQAPPAGLALGFGAACGLYLAYPWGYTGETVECLLGLGLAWAALLARPDLATSRPLRASVTLLGAGALAIACTAALRPVPAADGPLRSQAVVELTALRADLLKVAAAEGRTLPAPCAIHDRLAVYLGPRKAETLSGGEFMRLPMAARSPERATFLLDPWNMPYWVRTTCREKGAVSVVYSYGPNRRRESTETEILGDDVGVRVVVQYGAE